jgi:catechol-2,3-dioxygenase
LTTTSLPAIGIKRLQHIVLQVSDIERSIAFYSDVCGFQLHRRRPNGNAFLTIPGSDNDHDLALFPREGGTPAGPPDKSLAGLIHMAFEVNDLPDLVRARRRLEQAGAFDGTTNHGMSLSVYGRDPDGLGFEFFWTVPGATAGENLPLDIEAELARRGMAAPE